MGTDLLEPEFRKTVQRTKLYYNSRSMEIMKMLSSNVLYISLNGQKLLTTVVCCCLMGLFCVLGLMCLVVFMTSIHTWLSHIMTRCTPVVCNNLQ